MMNITISERLRKPKLSKRSIALLQQSSTIHYAFNIKHKVIVIFLILIFTSAAFQMVSIVYANQTSTIQNATVKNRFNSYVYLQPSARWESEIWLLDDASSVTERLQLFNDALTSYRKTALLKLIALPANDTDSIYRPTAIHTVEYKYGFDYFKNLRKFNLTSHLATIFIKWIESSNNNLKNASSLTYENENLIFTRSYRWTGVKPPCVWQDFKYPQRFEFDKEYCQPYEKFSHNVLINMTVILSQSPGALDAVYTKKYSRVVDEFSPKYTFFVHVAKDAIVSPVGHVYVKNVIIKSNGCSADKLKMKNYQSYDEIYTISQMWANHSFYHWMIDSIARMAVMLDFLRRHVTIRIHMGVRNKQIDEVFTVLGLDPKRIITGYAFGKVVYLPRATHCYEAALLDMQALSNEYKRFIEKTTNNTVRNSVVYIRRNKERKFANNSQTEGITKRLSEQYKLKFELFTDDKLPSVKETMYMFNRARVIVAPHGAGLLNMQYSRQGTVILEAIDNTVNCPCFLLMAHVLGHKYHAIGATGGRKIVHVNLTDFEKSVAFHIKYAAEHSSLFN